jgi:hypothetical protein
VPSTVDGSRPDQRIAEAAALLPPHGAVTGWAALHWRGSAWFAGVDAFAVERPVPLAMAVHARKPQPGILLVEERLTPTDVELVDGLRATTAVRSVCYEMRHAASVRRAVQALDMAAYSDLVSLAEITHYALDHPGWTGIPQCREAIGMSNENVWSPRETDLRLMWELDAGLDRPLCNVPIFDLSGRHIGTPDLFDPGCGLVGEYDGAIHLAGEQRARDVRRDETYRQHALEVFTMVAADLADRSRAVDRLSATHARASRRSVQQSWTLTPPPWWVDTSTVERRRALSTLERARWLRLRLRAG